MLRMTDHPSHLNPTNRLHGHAYSDMMEATSMTESMISLDPLQISLKVSHIWPRNGTFEKEKVKGPW